MSLGTEGELVFAVSVSSFTEKGYMGSASFHGKPVDFEFDDGDAGVFLTAEMCSRLGVKEGSKVLVVVETDGEPLSVEITAAGTAPRSRISNARVYYAVGKEGGAVLKMRRP